MDKKPLVSVVMPIYKHSEEQLMEAIDSILTQTFTDFEFIIVDGNRRNINSNIIAKISDQRIKYFKKAGYINCLNEGIKKSIGKYIARMDSDDISYPDRLKEQVAFMEENPQIDLCSCRAKRFGDVHKESSTRAENDITLISLIKDQQLVHSAMIFRRKLNVQYESIMPVEDCLLFRKLLLNGKKFSVIDKVLFKNRINRASIISRYPDYTNLLLSKTNVMVLAEYCDCSLSFKDQIITKKEFTRSDIIEFLEFVRIAAKKTSESNLDVLKLFFHYFHYTLSHTRAKLSFYFIPLYYQTYLFYDLKIIAKRILQSVFSVKNEYVNKIKIKVIRILGIKIKIRTSYA